MEPILKTIRRSIQSLQSSEEWVELIRDLDAPIPELKLANEFQMRWAEKDDLQVINALEGYIKEATFLESSLDYGDRCLLFEKAGLICAFAWVTFKDYALNIWHTLRLPAGYAYLVYIYVRPEYRCQGVGSCLLCRLMKFLQILGLTKIISGMYRDWHISMRLHTKVGFRFYRVFTEKRIFRFVLLPPKVMQFE